MKMTHNEAIEALAAGDENRAWALAKQDEGLELGVTRAKWLAYGRRLLAFRARDAERETLAAAFVANGLPDMAATMRAGGERAALIMATVKAFNANKGA